MKKVLSKTKILGKIDFNNEALRRDLAVIERFPVFDEEYSEFNQGTWINNSLWNDNGDYRNTQYKDYPGEAKLTELGHETLYINEVIHQYFDVDNLKMVRTRNLINGQVIPHKDFVEFGQQKEKYLRVLIPLESPMTSYHSDEDYGVFRMRKGEIWMLDASVVHAAYNFGQDNRVILCLDFQFEGVDKLYPEMIFTDLSTGDNLQHPMVFKRQALTKKDRQDFVNELARSIHNLEDIKNAVFKLSFAHIHHDIPIQEIYDILIELTQNKGQHIQSYCREMKQYYIGKRGLGQRFTLV
ncbi:Proline hydroxylase [Vibrio crassostreae]|uniref:2-oxoglutarate-dependent hydroxylase n=1 Tax=Vibrio coralliirubri TaxID=1516159 RepID=A0AA86XP91_9VIBR|nr:MULTISPECIES: aspartyl/asparaginyl beta-hydroxylase domain-containing protein [Vibrio]CAK1727718.1 Proline hydroxylase [Vibrio crassostreae]CAK1737677.1 Proline hydroxylase [Vibrio crassostreae]CAK2001937.1 Proline hydroxylase [Vibrio crassostreae]CAK2013439.1 Proline hydroxylase [Vibrio crassostreae]CAK2136176.1 Proline hydroxylase [Vibrio crassostreae]